MFKKKLDRLEKRIHILSGQPVQHQFFSLGWWLLQLSHLYKTGIQLRYRLYKAGVFKTKKLSCKVISIGNAAVGGTGKTPMAIYLAKLLKEMGRKPVVISRGYKGDYKGECLIVSDGETLLSDAEESGDEPFMMAQEKLFPVVIGKNRVKAGELAVKKFDCDVIVLDDGFQHLKLSRDIDLLLLDHDQPFGNGCFLPAGRLRESSDMALSRADAVIFTRSREVENSGSDNDEKGETASLKQDDIPESVQCVLDGCPETPCFKTSHVPFLAQKIPANNMIEGSENSLNDYSGRKALAFSGLAENRAFYKVLRQAGIIILDHLEFKDHYRYKKSDMLQIRKIAKAIRADLIVTTQKDWVKLDPDFNWKVDLAVAGIEISFQDSERFEAFLNARLQ